MISTIQRESEDENLEILFANKKKQDFLTKHIFDMYLLTYHYSCFLVNFCTFDTYTHSLEGRHILDLGIWSFFVSTDKNPKTAF